MTVKRRSVWGLVLTGLLAVAQVGQAQEVEPVLIDDVSRPADVTPRDLPKPVATSEQTQIRLDVVMWEVDGKKLKEITGVSDLPLRELLKLNGIKPAKDDQRVAGPLVQAIGHPLRLEFEGRDFKPAIKRLSEPSLITISGQDVTVVSGGAFPVPIPTDAIGSRKVEFRDFGIKVIAKPVWIKDGRIFLDVIAENSERGEPTVQIGDLKVPAITTRRMAATSELRPGQSLLLINDITESAQSLMVQITPTLLSEAPSVAVLPAPEPQVTPQPPAVIEGKGVNSDAGVTGKIVLEDKATQTKLTAKSLSIVVPNVFSFGAQVGQRCLLVAVPEHDGRNYEVRLVAQPVVLELMDGHVGEDSHRADVGLRAESQAVAEKILNAAQALQPKESFYLVPLPAGMQQVAQADLRRVFEHASIRAELTQEEARSPKDAAEVIEIAVGQKSVRAPINRQIVALLPAPKGNYSDYVSIFHSQQKGVRQIAGLTVFFVSEAAIELEALIEETESTAKVSVIEVRDAVLLRGDVTSEDQKKSLVEVAEQFYPKVLDQLKVQGAAAEFTRNLPHPERLFVNPSSAAAIQQVVAEESGRTTQPPTREAASQLERHQTRTVTPDRLPSIEELRELRDEVKGLRRDVQQLTKQLEHDRAEAKEAEQTKADLSSPAPTLPNPPQSQAEGSASRDVRVDVPTSNGERWIERQLNQEVRFEFVDLPLAAALRQLRAMLDLNIVIDAEGLEETGIKTTEPVSLQVSDISGRSALKLILDPLGLAVMHKDEALVVTSRDRAKGPLIVKVYPVADLVTPIPGKDLESGPTKTNDNALMQLLTSTIEPDSWEEVGGTGSVKFNAATLGLAIRQTEEVHEEVAELLSQLRNLHDLQVTLEMRVVTLPKNLVPGTIAQAPNDGPAVVMTEPNISSLIRSWQADRRTNTLMAPKVTLFQGQTVNVSADIIRLVLRSSASGDRQFVQLGLGINGESFDSTSRQLHQRLKTDETLMLDVTEDMSEPATLLKQIGVTTDTGPAREILKKLQTNSGDRVLLLVTPRIIDVEEEQLQTDAKKVLRAESQAVKDEFRDPVK